MEIKMMVILPMSWSLKLGSRRYAARVSRRNRMLGGKEQEQGDMIRHTQKHEPGNAHA